MNKRKKNKNKAKSTSTEPNRIKQLQEIREDALATSNPYQLSDKEHNDLVIVLNTLDYITENSNELSKRNGNARTTFFISKDPKKHAPIHLENYPTGDDGEKLMLGSLVDMFINSFDNVKKLHPIYVKEFCSKLDGDCIDIRTKPAFDYALTVGKIPTFTECMKKASNALTEKEVFPSYFDYFISIYNHFWNKPYSKDSTNPGYTEKDGIFDEASFPLIARFLADLGLKPDSTIFSTLSNLPAIPVLARFLILSFALSHDTFFDELGLKDRSEEDISADCKNIKDPFLQREYDKWLLEIKIIKENGFDLSSEKQFQKLINLLNRCGHPIFFEILAKNLIFKKINHEQRKTLLELCIKRLEKCKNNSSLVTSVLYMDMGIDLESLLFLAVKLKNTLAVKKLLLLYPGDKQPTSRPLNQAVEDKSWDIIEIFAETNIEKTKSKVNYSYLFALFIAIENQKIDLFYKLLARIPSEQIGRDAITKVLESNNTSLCEAILKNITHLAMIDFLIIDLYNKKVKDSTLDWFLNHPKTISLLTVTLHDRLISPIITIIRACTDIEKLKIFLSKPYLNIGPADRALSEIDNKPNAEKIKELFSSTEMKFRMAHNKVHFHKDYQDAINILSDIYSEKTDSQLFDFANILKLDELNPYQQKLLANLFLTKNFKLIRNKKDRALFDVLERHVSTDTITTEMRAAFPKAEPASTATTSVAANPASFLYHGPARENKRSDPPAILADDESAQAPTAKKAKRSQKK
jgi:hypothetical protein